MTVYQMLCTLSLNYWEILLWQVRLVPSRSCTLSPIRTNCSPELKGVQSKTLWHKPFVDDTCASVNRSVSRTLSDLFSIWFETDYWCSNSNNHLRPIINCTLLWPHYGCPVCIFVYLNATCQIRHWLCLC